MIRQRRRKCHHCQQLYQADPRSRWHQRYCAESACRRASKAASQASWRASPEGRDYFRGTANVLRVQLWRKAHPGYWKTRRPNPLDPTVVGFDEHERQRELRQRIRDAAANAARTGDDDVIGET